MLTHLNNAIGCVVSRVSDATLVYQLQVVWKIVYPGGTHFGFIGNPYCTQNVIEYKIRHKRQQTSPTPLIIQQSSLRKCSPALKESLNIQRRKNVSSHKNMVRKLRRHRRDTAQPISAFEINHHRRLLAGVAGVSAHSLTDHFLLAIDTTDWFQSSQFNNQ